ncbi:DUF6339 family protein [Streptomyces sp. NPDC002688]|uniref:DUF6339 family protein n=1 Tax=Streptomyces sp. NPDC002688 TaxID=3154423 RepID=UPI00331DFA9C
MTQTPTDLPEYFCAVPDIAAAKYLTHSVLSGRERPPRVALLRLGQVIDPPAARWRVAPVRDLLDEARRRYEDDRASADGWLAPRLHATMRMTRREAANSGLWNFLALVVAPDYVLWRHKGVTKEGERATADRFVGVHYKQAFARLWWAAEMFRDGDDYGPVVSACSVQDVLNTVLRYEIIDHRPTARAVVSLLESGVVRTGRDVNGLGTAINAAGSTLLYDVLAPDDGPDADARRYWMGEADNAGPVPMEGLPDGPDDGRIPRTSVETLVQRFGELFAEAPVRGKERNGDVPSPRRGVSLDKPYSPS